MHIYVDDQLPFVATALQPLGTVETYSARALPQDMQVKGTQALFVRSTTWVDETFLRNTGVRFVASATAGTDHVDTAWLEHNGIAFVSAPGSNANAVAEYVMMAMAAVDAAPPRTLGIVGYGNVGKRLAIHARHAGYRVLVNDPPLLERKNLFDAEHVALDELLTTADVVSLHLPLTADGIYATGNLISEARVRSMRPGTLFINAARGGIADEAALLYRIRSGTLSAILDVFAGEPYIDSALVQAAALCTPHIAGYTATAKANSARMVVDAFYRWLGIVPAEAIAVQHATGYRSPAADSLAFRDAASAVPLHIAFDTFRKTYPLVPEHLADPIPIIPGPSCPSTSNQSPFPD